MFDKNGKIIRAGDIVRIEGAYFAHDNALYFVEHEPGGADWSGIDYALIRICRNGKISAGKYKNAFYPLLTFTNSRAKREEANAWNKEHATIEIISGINTAYIIEFFEQEIADAKNRKKRYFQWQDSYAENVEREEKYIAYYKDIISRIRKLEKAIPENPDKALGENSDKQSEQIEQIEQIEQTEPELEAAEAEETKPENPVTYYPINEQVARRAKEMNSFSDYVPGSATAEYRAKIDAAAAEVARHKARVDEMYHEKIDAMFNKYCHKLAENLNAAHSIDASYPSVMIAGPAGFNCRKKEKQNARRDANMQEYRSLDDYLQKILSVGNGGIMSDDKRALEKLRLKVEKLEEKQELMKAANAAIRMKDAVKGDAKLKELGYSEEEIIKLREPDFCGRVGYPSFELSLNNQNIHRLKDRITQLEKEQERAKSGEAEDIQGDGWTLTENAEEMRIQFIFDGKPDADTRSLLKSNGFRWAPSQGAWQRLLNDNGRYAAQRIMKALNA